MLVGTVFAGCWRTRRSTSGGLALLGTHIVRHWSVTQTTVALSSAEAELTGMTKGASIGIGLVALCADLNVQARVRLHSDATAAIGIARGRGLGKIRHRAVSDLWLQDKTRVQEVEVVKAAGSDNPADILTMQVAAMC